MTEAKRPRGRPLGSCINDDPILLEIAELIVASEGAGKTLRLTTALRRVVGAPSEALVRRLQRKWRAGSSKYLAKAHKQRAVSAQPSTPAYRHGHHDYQTRGLDRIYSYLTSSTQPFGYRETAFRARNTAYHEEILRSDLRRQLQ